MMNPTVRKLLLIAHIAVSVGWVGAVVAYLAVVIAAMNTHNDQLLRAAWIALQVIASYVIVPLALAALFSGIGIALGTPWKLFRHYWVLGSLILTAIATGVLLKHMSTINGFASMAADPSLQDVSGVLAPALRGELLHAGVGLLVLLVVEALNVYKPRGLTAYGRKLSPAPAKGRAQAAGIQPRRAGIEKRTPRWVHAVWIHAAAILVLIVIMHLRGDGLRLHN